MQAAGKETAKALAAAAAAKDTAEKVKTYRPFDFMWDGGGGDLSNTGSWHSDWSGGLMSLTGIASLTCIEPPTNDILSASRFDPLIDIDPIMLYVLCDDDECDHDD